MSATSLAVGYASVQAGSPSGVQEAFPASSAFSAPRREEAFHGLAGEIVRTIEPHSEADPYAILLQLLAAFGNVVGRGPHFVADGAAHYTNINVLLVGETSKARKGTAWAHVKRLMQRVSSDWARDRIQSGLSSGEGLISAVQDYSPMRDAPAVTDKRLFVVEAEFSRPLAAMQRDGNTLSAILRDAWDGADVLRVMTRASPLQATEAHVSVVGHITAEELRRKLTSTEMANGFANRFLFGYVRRSKTLPFGGALSDSILEPLIERLREAVGFAKGVGRLQFDDEARELWGRVYGPLSDGKPGLVGEVTARAEAQVVRLACLYALLDCSTIIRLSHLRAALALWSFAEWSANSIFGARTGYTLEDAVECALREAGNDGMTQTALNERFGGHKSAEQLAQALEALESRRRARQEAVPTGGRPATRWYAEEAEKADKGLEAANAQL